MTMRRGDLFRHEVAGAGGWGDPLERDPALVLKDVRNEFVSPDAAREDYGVVLAGEPLTVDEAATGALREAMRARQGDRPVRYTLGNGARGGIEDQMETAVDLVIFDCDGVLVDSEPIFSRAHAEILSQYGYETTPETVGERFCGISDAEMLAAIEREWGKALPPDYHNRVAVLADASCAAMLNTFPGIHETLDLVTAPICVASSSTPKRIRKSLALTGLLDRFDPCIFSAVMVVARKARARSVPVGRADDASGPGARCRHRGQRAGSQSGRIGWYGRDRVLRRQSLPGGA